MKTEIIPVGTEILLGNIVDTDSSFLASELSSLGLDLYFISTVGDNHDRLFDTLKRAWERAGLIIVTGGLGPTQDDITREAIGMLVDEELRVDEALWQELRNLFSRYPGRIPEGNTKQAAVIPSAQVIHNSMGTAPGWWVEKDGHIIIALPGPPEEMKLMWQESVRPRLKQKTGEAIILSRTIKTFQVAEARVDELVAPISGLSNPTLATYINPDGVYLRITAKAQRREEAESLVRRTEEQVRAMLASHIWGVDDETLESVVGDLLRSRELRLATMESCTAGLLCTTVAGGRESCIFYRGGLLACSHEAKTALGVGVQPGEPHGEENLKVAKAMAETARQSLNADIGLGVGGRLSCDTNSGDVFTAIVWDEFDMTHTHRVRGNHLRMKQRATYAALFDLRRVLLERRINAPDH